MSKPPQKRPAKLKMKIAVESLKGDQSISQIASEYGIHPKQVRRWRDQLLSEGEDIFVHKTLQKSADPDKEKLLHVIEQLSLELDFLKKKLKRNT